MLKFAVVFLLVFGSAAVSAQSAKADTHAAPASSEASTGQHNNWTMEQAITSSVREAWVLGGRNEDGFLEIVKALTALSAQKRGLTLPETKEAGEQAGQIINKMARADRDQLLYVVVDKAVQQVGKPAAK